MGGVATREKPYKPAANDYTDDDSSFANQTQEKPYKFSRHTREPHKKATRDNDAACW